jgi:4-hydroxy-tetrahydrodipicolinate reductase
MTELRIRLLIHGASGRMGRSLIASLTEHSQLHLVAAVASAPRSDLGALSVLPPSQLVHAPAFDVAVDFSAPSGLRALGDVCVARGAALVSGTTGLDEAAQDALTSWSSHIPVLWSANFSLGIALLTRLVRQAAAALPDWDCEVVEVHHQRKKDAPSGTALKLGESVAAARGVDLSAVARHGREGVSATRQPGEIGFHALRGGDVVGDHRVNFFAASEHIELAHHAASRDVFAHGALKAARWLARQRPGRYSLDDLLDL